MAKYRHVYVGFWQDAKVLEEMTPEDKYFYLYLLTNPNTTQIGVYQITKKQMAFDLGYSTESIKSLLDRFINSHELVKYNEETREMAVVNWGKYNLNKAGKPMIDCIKKELLDVKDKSLLNEIMANIPNEAILEEFSRYVNDTSDDTSTSGGQKEKEKEKEKEKKDTPYSNEFERFWSIYPKRVDKKKAYKSFKTALKNHDIETIITGTEKYARYIQRSRTDRQFVKHPTTFLNNDSFIDGFEEGAAQPNASTQYDNLF